MTQKPCVIPPREELELAGYTPDELGKLEQAAAVVNGIPEEDRRREIGRMILRKLWPDEIQYIAKTHWIMTKKAGHKQLLEPNYAQVRFYEDVIQHCRAEAVPIRGIILKARQLGFSTFIQAWQYEQCDRNNLRTSMTVSYDTDSTKEMFQKAKMIHGHSWFPHKAKRDSRGVVELVNESTFYTRTAGNTRVGRSQTIHHCHCSEIPMWDDPAEALTSLTACVPVSPDSSLLYESTAKGAVGEFYQAWRDASRGESDMVPFFAPWFWDPEYKLGFPSEDHRRKFGRDLGHKDRRYMERHSLSLEQMRWRQKKIQGYSGSIRRFRQEFPAEPMEAFLTTGSPAFDPDAVQELASNTTQPYFQGDIVIER